MLDATRGGGTSCEFVEAVERRALPAWEGDGLSAGSAPGTPLPLGGRGVDAARDPAREYDRLTLDEERSDGGRLHPGVRDQRS
jgi:hypothetical protein